MFRVIVTVLLFMGVESCERGLTQLRHRDTLALMRCVPTLPGQPDPCIVQTGGQMAFCQRDGQDYMCCGTQELLIQLLAGRPSHTRPTPDFWKFYSTSTSQFDYNVFMKVPEHKTQTSIITTSTTQPPRTTYLRRLVHSPTSDSSTLLTLLASPKQLPGNYTSSLRLSSNVVVVRDSKCTIVVNTGMPHQRDEIYQNLNAIGLSPHDIQFVVITSAQPQFVGNLNLFPEAQIIFERHFLYKEHLVKGGIDEGVRVEICSPNTFLLATPGPTENSVSLIARNVPTLGTVAISGSLFLNGSEITKNDEEFWNDKRKTIESRETILCEADWVLPAHAPAFHITSQQQSNCSI